ncbi:cell division protein ZipA [Hahella ganghwensis]|uniref:cell division protein ZipA n=1 Tax=Hahella ganghwensis TaxID=286420 RepID=UPI0003799E24|nr:cell division protein ZipA [Hahella ganghwensis]
MDNSLREWLVILGVLIIIIVVLDGVRRARRARRDSMEISQGMGGNFENTPLDDGFNPELPGSGFRVVREGKDSRHPDQMDDERQQRSPYADLEEDDSEEEYAEDRYSQESYSQRGYSQEQSQDRYSQDDDVEENAEEYVEEHYASKPREHEYIREEHEEPYFSEKESEYYSEEPLRADPQWEDQSEAVEPMPPEYASSRDEEAYDSSELHAEVEDKPVRAEEKHNDFKDRFLKKISTNMDAIQESLHQKHQKSKEKSKDRKAKRQESRKSKDNNREEIIVVNVLAKAQEGFEGSKLRHLVEACGMQIGEMSIYHRHEYDFDKGPVQFSMANAVKPGTFDRDMDESTTPGVSFFIRLPGPDDSMQAFDYMIETAQCIVRNLDGELKDENLSVMTSQTIEHCRQRVREFERKQLSSKV